MHLSDRIEVKQLSAREIDQHLNALCDILQHTVAEGGAVGFLAPLPRTAAAAFWTTSVRPEVASGARQIFGAFAGSELRGTTQLLLQMPANQPHRAEIAKMMVHPDARRLGLATALLEAAFSAARAAGKTLLTLDTRSGDTAEQLYTRLGFASAGLIPDYALDPDGDALHATTYMYKRL